MILVDTSVLYAIFEVTDTQHQKAKDTYFKIPNNQILITDSVLKELFTLVNRRKDSQITAQVYNELDQDPRKPTIYNFDTLEFFEFLDFFINLKKNKLSTTDLELLFLHKKYNFKVLTFDEELNKLLK